MKFQVPENADDDEFVKIFIDIALQQQDSHLDFDTPRFNRLYKRMKELTDRLKSMPGDRRSALCPLLNHPNIEVRLRAAFNTLAVSPQSARMTLEAIASSGEQPQAGEAGMALLALDDGIFKPT